MLQHTVSSAVNQIIYLVKCLAEEENLLRLCDLGNQPVPLIHAILM